jgi:hypothetical protein
MIDFLLGVPGKLKTISDLLTTYWTAARAAKLDYLTGNVALASTAVSNADYTSTRATFLDSTISGRLGSIKAIYKGTVTINNSSQSGTVTITSVNTAKSLCFFMGWMYISGGGNVPTGNDYPRIELTDSTTVTATRGAVTTTSIAVGYIVVEFN